MNKNIIQVGASIATIIGAIIPTIIYWEQLSSIAKVFLSYRIPIYSLIIILLAIILCSTIIKRRRKQWKPFKYTEKTLKQDLDLFNQIKTELINEKRLYNLKKNVFSSLFHHDDLEFIYEIREANQNPEFEFLNPRLEILKEEWVASIEELDKALSKNIFGRRDSPGYLEIPREWTTKRYEAEKLIEKKTEIVCQKYDLLIKIGRRELLS